MKKIFAIGFFLLLTALPNFSQKSENAETKVDNSAEKTSDEQRKKLFSDWEAKKEQSPKEACQIAVEYLVKFPDEKNGQTQILKKWLEENKEVAACQLPALKTEKTESKIKKPATMDGAAGTWIIVVTTTQGDLQFTLVLQQEGKKISGSVQSPYGNGTITDGAIDGKLINLDIAAEPLEVILKGTIEDGKMKGTVSSNIPNIGELPFVGTRSK